MAELTDEQRDTGGEPLDALMGAVKVAAASAAVGAAAAAAKALADRRDHHEEEPVEEEAPPEPELAAGDEEEDQEPEPRAEEPQEPAEPEELRGEESQEQEEEEEEPVEGASMQDASTAAQRARQQLEELLGKEVESVSSLERTHDGWVIALEVVELQRIPESTDVLGSYELELDDDLNFRRYQQARRYTRSQADRGDDS
jgi:hypothetical protein